MFKLNSKSENIFMYFKVAPLSLLYFVSFDFYSKKSLHLLPMNLKENPNQINFI